MFFLKINPKALKIAKPDHDLKKLMFSAGARRAAASFLTIYSQIYVYEILKNHGYSVKLSIILVAVYIMISFITKLIALNYSEDLSRNIGFKQTIRLSLIPFVLYLLFIINAKSYIPFLWVASSVWGVHAGLFWWGYHGYFIKSGSPNHFGESLGEAGFLEILASILAPILGAVIAIDFGFNSIFILAGTFMIISLVLLGADHEKRQIVDVSFSEVFRNIVKHKSVSLAYMGNGGEGVLYVIFWPLFLYLTFGKLLTLGWIITLANVLTAVFAIWFGRRADRQKERGLLTNGISLMTASWFIRLIFASAPIYVVTDFIRNFGEKMVTMPLNVVSYRKAFEGKSSARAILFRETSLIIGVVMALVSIIFWLLIIGSMKYWFILPMVFIVLPMFSVIRKKI